jgi:hypothetical protein
MFRFSIFVFGRLSAYKDLLTREELDAKIAWAIEYDFSYSVEAV